MFSNSHQGHATNVRNNNSRQQSRRGVMRRMLPMGSTGSQAMQSPVVYMQPGMTQPQQQLQGNPNFGNPNNGMMMMMVAPQQLSQIMSDQVPDNQYMATGSVAQVNPEQYMTGYQQQQQESHKGKRIPVVGPLGSSNTVMQGQQQQQQQQPQQPEGYMAPQNMASELAYRATNGAAGSVATAGMEQPGLQGQTRQVVNHRPPPRATMNDAATEAQPIMTSSGAGQQQMLDVSNGQNGYGTNSNKNNMMDAVELHPQQLSDASSNMVQADTPAVQQQASPAKQAVYYYDPKDTAYAHNGDILQLPKVVYDVNGKAIPLSELRQAPIYVQPPMMGATSGSTTSVISNGESIPDASSLDMQAAPAREAVQMPQISNWGKSTSQDQSVIVATVAVMALLVGALSARRLRSKSFLASCIENETLEDDMAYDSAYTTTAGPVGADSSYNTFGGWKGDLEKFDV